MTAATALTVRALKTFARSPKTKDAIAQVIAARIAAKVTREKVDAYILPVFQRFTFTDEDSGEAITTPKHLYLADLKSQTMLDYEAACDAEHVRQGWKIPTGYCPACMAESAAIDAEQKLLKLAGEAFGAPFATTHGETREKALALFLDVVKLPA